MKNTNNIKYFTKYELSSLFDVIDKCTLRNSLRNAAIIKIGYYCALRASEIGLIEKTDFNSNMNSIYCKRLKGGINNTLRIVDKGILKTLRKYISKCENNKILCMFPSQKNKPISRQMLDKLMKFYCEEAEIIDKSKWHFHVLRHSRAVHMAEDGLNVTDIQYWLGHSQIRNTMIYLTYTSRQQEELYRKLTHKKEETLNSKFLEVLKAPENDELLTSLRQIIASLDFD